MPALGDICPGSTSRISIFRDSEMGLKGLVGCSEGRKSFNRACSSSSMLNKGSTPVFELLKAIFILNEIVLDCFDLIRPLNELRDHSPIHVLQHRKRPVLRSIRPFRPHAQQARHSIDRSPFTEIRIRHRLSIVRGIQNFA